MQAKDFLKPFGSLHRQFGFLWHQIIPDKYRLKASGCSRVPATIRPLNRAMISWDTFSALLEDQGGVLSTEKSCYNLLLSAFALKPLNSLVSYELLMLCGA